jgi:lysosomal acid lipase/cholesteryl ester hydrolase
MTSYLLTSNTPPIDYRSPLLKPKSGAPLYNDPSLIPEKYRVDSEKADLCQDPSSTAKAIRLVRSPPSTLLDASTRAAMNLPNEQTALAQARAMRGYHDTSEFDPLASSPPNSSGSEYTPLIAPSPQRAGSKSFLSPPGHSSSSSALGRKTRRPSSAGSNGNILRRFIQRATTPSQELARPTFPPPTLTTYHPLPFAPLTFNAKVALFFSQAASVAVSTVALAIVVGWALFIEVKQKLPQWIWPTKKKVFPWDNDAYWRKEGRKVSKEPRDYARQVGLDIEDQVVETEDGYYLK